jgi:hypothetical protein
MEELKKYRITEYLENLPAKDYSQALKILQSVLNVSLNTIYCWREIKIEDKTDIPHEKVRLLEALFEMEAGGLSNTSCKVSTLKELLRTARNETS